MLNNKTKKTMENVKMTKTQVFNVIILDKSGSMESIRKAAIDGFNETLNGIKKAQEKYAETQEQLLTLVTFCNCEKMLVYDNLPVTEAKALTVNDYQPCCGTPLYDAMGFTLTSMRKHVKEIDDAVVVVTIITDGEENSSREYSGKAIKELVEQLRAEGWSFTYMGANQDSVEVAISLSIRNARNFECSDEGVQKSWEREANTRSNFYARLHESRMEQGSINVDSAVCKANYAAMADEAFDEEESKG